MEKNEEKNGADSQVNALLTHWRSQAVQLCQNSLLDAHSFYRFGRDRGIGMVPGDPRLLQTRGWLPADGERPDGLPLFHPFRFYTSHRVLSASALHVASSASIHREQFADLVARIEQSLRPLKDLNRIAADANQIVDLAILAEPIYWPVITGRTVGLQAGSDEEHADLMATYTESVEKLVTELSVDEWRDRHERLRFTAAQLDKNGDLYLLLRISPWQRRKRVTGPISGAMWIRHMAEVLRLTFEKIHGATWDEEDRAFGQWTAGARVRTYGSERPLDRPIGSKPYFAFHFGLHTGSTVRWYLEGDTELGAVARALPGAAVGGIELVNLRGSLSGKAGTALKLAGMLKKDMEMRRFSIISFDLDAADSVRAVQTQIRRGHVVGYVWAHDPDFEFGNFELHELVEVASRLDERAEVSADAIRSGDWSGVSNAKVFQKRYQELSVQRAGLKGLEWGKALAEYAFEDPEGAFGKRRRPFIRSIEVTLRCRLVSYDLHAAAFRIDPNTFELVELEDPPEPWEK